MIKKRFKARVRNSLDGIPVKKDKSYQKSLIRSKKQFDLDRQIFKEIDMCSFIRPIVPGELDGFVLPEEIDDRDIRWVYVLDPGSMSHVREHMKILPTHTGAVMFDITDGEQAHARILLDQAQMEIIRESMNKVEIGKIVNGKLTRNET
jgi:hypothetical protein